MRRARRLVFVALGGLGVVLLAAIVASMVDTRAHHGRVLRNTRLAGQPVGGLDERRLASAVDTVAAKFAANVVDVKAPGGGFIVPSRELGVRVDAAATVKDTMRVGRTGSPPARFLGWVRSFRGHRAAPLRVAV